MEEEKYEIDELSAMTLLAETLNDTPTEIVIGGEKYHIRGLRLGTQNLIAEETCRIQKAQEGNMIDLYKQFAQCIPAVIKCLCYAILNDKGKIFKDYATRQYSDEFNALYERIEWESDKDTWVEVLVNVMNKIDLRFFYQAVNMLTMMRDSALKTRKKIATERT